MNKLKFALIGTGGIAQTYAQAFQQSDCCNLVAVADVNEDSAKAFAEPFGAKSFSDYKTLAENTEIDAVIVSTPPNSHPEIAMFFMQKGVNVLCEKPLCLSVAEAKQMIETAEKSNVVFTMATKFRYCEDVVKAKAIIASGVLGEIVQFENAFTAKVDMSKRWNSKKEISGGGVLMDNGTHSVDIIRYFLGAITDVFALETSGTQNLSVDENVKLLAKTENGIAASVDLTWGINKELPNFISVYGTNGTLAHRLARIEIQTKFVARLDSFRQRLRQSSGFSFENRKFPQRDSRRRRTFNQTRRRARFGRSHRSGL